MASRIDWYLVELERRLEGKLPMRKIQSIFDEARDHLLASKEDFMLHGYDPQVAEAKAVEAFGRHDVICDRLLYSATKTTFGVRTESLVLLWMLALAVVYPLHHFVFDGRNMVGKSMYVGLGMLLVAIGFFFRTRRIQWGAITACVIVFTGFVTAFSIPDSVWDPQTGNNFSLLDLKRSRPQMTELVKKYSSSKALFEEGRKAFAAGTAATNLTFHNPTYGYLAPRSEPQPYYASVDDLRWTASLGHATNLWKEHAHAYIASAEAARTEYQRSLDFTARLIALGPVGVSQVIERFHLVLFQGVIMVGILAFLNWIALNLGRIGLRRIRWPETA